MNRMKQIKIPERKRLAGLSGFAKRCWHVCIGRGGQWSHNPLFVAGFTALVGAVAFVVQTNVQHSNELLHARLGVLNEMSGLYGSMTSNLDQLGKARCEMMDKRLSAVEVNTRSSEIQDRLARTREQVTALTFRLAALFSPRTPWYRRYYNRAKRGLFPPDPAKEKYKDDLLYDFQQFYQYYLDFETQGVALTRKIPVGISCASDDMSYLNEFHHRMPFKFIRLFNRMAPYIDVEKLDAEVKQNARPEAAQVFNIDLNGRSVKVECRINASNLGQCVPK